MKKETHIRSQESVEKDLRGVALFKNCTDSFFSKLSEKAQHQHFSKGKILFVHDDNAERFYFIKSGWVKLFRETLDGAQAVVDIIDSGHIFGETAIFEDNIYPYSAEVVDELEIISFPLSDLKTEIESNSKLAFNMLEYMSSRSRLLDKEIEHRTIQNASQRIGCFLLRLAKKKEGESLTIHLPYDKTLVASRLGMQPETFSRALAKLRDQTGIRIYGASIEMDSIDQLVQYSCATCSSEFPCKDLEKNKSA